MGEARIRHLNRIKVLEASSWEFPDDFRIQLEALVPINAKPFEDWTQQETGQFFRAARIAAERTAHGRIHPQEGREPPPSRQGGFGTIPVGPSTLPIGSTN